MASGFRDLEEPNSTSLLEVDGVILSQNDTLPLNFDRKKDAPLIGLKTSSPFYSTRTRYRASVLLARDPPTPWIGPWKLIYYLDYLRIISVDAYHTVQKLRSTPSDLLLKHYLGRSLTAANPHLPTSSHNKLKAILGTPPPRSWDKKRSGEEKIEHIAFHPTVQIIALSTTFSRIHLFDLRTNMFLGYYLCAADSPADASVMAMAFSATNQLVVGLDTGCIDVWTIDIAPADPGPWTLTEKPMRALGPLFTPVRGSVQEVAVTVSGSPFGYRGSRSSVKPSSKPAFFSSHPSPGTQEILVEDAKVEGGRATLERVELVKGGFLDQEGLLGEVTAVVFSPGGKHVAVGTAVGGVWVYNVTLETVFRVLPPFALPAAGARCTALVWGVPPGVRSVPIRGEEGKGGRYQLETADTVLIVGMESGLVVYLRVRENGASSITIDSHPIEFYPGALAGVPVGGGVGQILLVPSTLDSESMQYGSFPTLLVSMRGSPGIHIFRLVPDSVLKASVPSASSVPSTPIKAAFAFKESSRYHGRWIYKQVLRAAGKFLGDYYRSYDRVRTVHVGSLDTGYVKFPPTTELPGDGGAGLEAGETTQYFTPRPVRSAGYGGVVRSMAIDPTGRRLIVSFVHGEGDAKGVEESVVWFDASGITSSASALGALGVLKPERVMTCEGEVGGIGGVGEVGFAGGCGSGVCAGMVIGGGMGVGIFRGFDTDGGGVGE